MSDILFCTTDGWEFQEGIYDFTKNYQVSSLLRLKPDILGLHVWKKYQDMDFSKYKLIWLHLNPRVMDPAWFQYPRFLRKKAPDAILFLKHEWWEKYYGEPMAHLLKRYFSYADYVGTNTKLGKEILERNLTLPIIYHHIGQPRIDEMDWPDPLPWEEREGIFVMRHTSRDSMVRKFEVGAETKISMTAIDAEPFTDGRQLKGLADAIGARAECYGRLEWTDFMDKIRRCRVALELDYVGISRVAYECAKVGVPMIGTNLAEYRNIIYPELGFEPEDMDGMMEKVVELHDGPEPKELNRFITRFIGSYWSQEACRERLFKLFEEIEYEYL